MPMERFSQFVGSLVSAAEAKYLKGKMLIKRDQPAQVTPRHG